MIGGTPTSGAASRPAVALLALLLLTAPSGLAANLAESLPARGNAWHIVSADVNGDGSADLVYACYDGAVYCQPASSGDVPRWKYDTGAFPYDLAVADLDGNGTSEVFVASADGHLYCINSDGSLRWKFLAPAPLYQVAPVRDDGVVRVCTGGVDRHLYVLSAAGKQEKAISYNRAIRLIRSGDLDGDGKPEVVVATWTGGVQVLRWPQLDTMWNAELNEKEPSATASSSAWCPQSLAIEDLDGDRARELIFGSGYDNRSAVRILSGKGSLRAENRDGMEPQDAWGAGHTTTVVCDFGPLIGRQIVALNGRYLFILDQTGRIRSQAAAPISFTNICRDEAATGAPTVYLSSSPNGDDRIYRLRLEKGWEQSFAALRREGKMLRVSENLERVRKQIAAYKGSPPTGQRYVQVVGGGSVASVEQVKSFFPLIGEYRRAFPYPNGVYSVALEIRPSEPVKGFPVAGPVRGRRVTPAEMVALLKECEKTKIPFILSVGHNCEPWVPLDIVERVAEQCPHTCVGFLSSEDDDHGDRLHRFLEDYWLPLMEVCRKFDKKAFLVEKHAWWTIVPAMKRFQRLVDSAYRDVLVMSVEDANSRCPELNLAGRLGLYLTGAVNNLSARSVSDEVCWNRLWEWECPLTGHPYLRRQMVQALLGAKYFEYNMPLRGWVSHGPSRFTPVGAESVALIAPMLGKGLLVPPSPGEMAALSPQVIFMGEPTEGFCHDAFNIHGHDTFAVDREAVDSPFEGLSCNWGASPVRPAYLGGYLFGLDRHFGGFIPATPYGLVPIVPASIGRERCFWSKGAWETDGRSWIVGGRRQSGLDARSSVLQSFSKASENLPVRLEGKAFMQAQTLGAHVLRITLIDPGFLDPADRPVTLQFRSDLRNNELADILSGERLAHTSSIELTVPAGAFRILEMHGTF